MYHYHFLPRCSYVLFPPAQPQILLWKLSQDYYPKTNIEPHLTKFQKPDITRILLIAKHYINRSLTPFLFSGRRKNFSFFKFLNNAYNTLTTEIQIKYQLNIFSCFFINNQMGFLIMLIAITFSIVKF